MFALNKNVLFILLFCARKHARLEYLSKALFALERFGLNIAKQNCVTTTTRRYRRAASLNIFPFRPPLAPPPSPNSVNRRPSNIYRSFGTVSSSLLTGFHEILPFGRCSSAHTHTHPHPHRHKHTYTHPHTHMHGCSGACSGVMRIIMICTII